MKLDQYGAPEIHRTKAEMNLATLIAFGELNLALSLVKHHPPLWRSYWVMNLKQLASATFAHRQMEFITQLHSSVQICSSSDSLSLVGVLNSSWFSKFSNSETIAEESKAALRSLELLLIERHGLRYVAKLQEGSDLLAVANGLKDIVRVNRKLAIQKASVERRQQSRLDGFMEEEAQTQAASKALELVFMESELLHQVGSS